MASNYFRPAERVKILLSEANTLSDSITALIKERERLYMLVLTILETEERDTDTSIEPAPSISINHPHNPVQHRDGKEPWCVFCKLNADHEVPKYKTNRGNN